MSRRPLIDRVALLEARIGADPAFSGPPPEELERLRAEAVERLRKRLEDAERRWAEEKARWDAMSLGERLADVKRRQREAADTYEARRRDYVPGTTSESLVQMAMLQVRALEFERADIERQVAQAKGASI